jgi:hypothetical protein
VPARSLAAPPPWLAPPPSSRSSSTKASSSPIVATRAPCSAVGQMAHRPSRSPSTTRYVMPVPLSVDHKLLFCHILPMCHRYKEEECFVHIRQNNVSYAQGSCALFFKLHILMFHLCSFYITKFITCVQRDRPDERARIESVGGHVIYDDMPRVRGALAMSRALGTSALFFCCFSERIHTQHTFL